MVQLEDHGHGAPEVAGSKPAVSFVCPVLAWPEPGPVSACDTCSQPGTCCRDFPLNVIRTSSHPTLLHAMIAAASTFYMPPEYAGSSIWHPWEGRLMLGLPFIPHKRDEGSGTFRWHCVNLLPNGRCGDYENRPYGPCVVFEPGQSKICVLHPDFGK